MPYARILFDVASYRAEAGHMDSGVKGDVVELSSDELDRLVALGAAEKATAKDHKDAADVVAAKAETVNPDGLTTPSGADAGDGKTDQDA